MNSVSYSQYSLWANCPLAWKLKYVDGHKLSEDTIHTIFGTAMHESIQEWLELLYGGKKNLAEKTDLDDGFREKFLTLFKEQTVTADDGTKTFLCDRGTLEEFYVQGTEILSYVQSNYKKIFPTENVELLGIEYPIEVEVRPGVMYVGYIDIITKNTKTNQIVLYDLKTSKKSWTQEQKSDAIKIGQLLLYKKFISQLMNVPLANISVEYVILKRTVFENTMYHIPRVSSFKPPHAKPSVDKTWNHFAEFLDDCFDEKGEYKTDTIKHKASKTACKWCAFKKRKDLCEYGV